MRRGITFFMMASCALCLAGACARPGAEVTLPAEQTVSVPSSTAPAQSMTPAFRETGIASWYGREMEGRLTADGTAFDMQGTSAAHRTLPLGTVIRITNLDNYKSITTTVTDRGPFIKDRIVELSYGAARVLGFVAQGTTSVRIETEGPVPEGGVWTVLAASFAEEENAKVLKYRLSQRYQVITIAPIKNNIGTFYRVLVGNYPSEEKAERIAAKLTLEGLEPVVIRKEE